MVYQFIRVRVLALALSIAFSGLTAAQVKPSPYPSLNGFQTLNFASLTEPGGNAAMGTSPPAFHGVGASYSQGGFTFTASDNPWGPQTLGAWKSGSPNHPFGGTRSTSLTAYYAGTRITVTATSGRFDLAAADLAQWGANQGGGKGSFPVTFHGLRDGREVVAQTFQVRRVPRSPLLATYRFKGFTNLDSVYVVEEGTFAAGYGFQLNNLVFRGRRGGGNTGPQGPQKGSGGTVEPKPSTSDSNDNQEPGSTPQEGSKDCPGPPGKDQLSAIVQARVRNGDFEEVRIAAPFFSSNAADIPGWTHSGTTGDGLIWAVGFQDASGSVSTAGHGSQFVTLGGGFQASGSASWTGTISGLTPGKSYRLCFMIANENQDSTPETLTVSFPSGSSTSPQSFSVKAGSGMYWTNWEARTEDFKATAGTATVNFSVADLHYDIALDYVRVAAAAPSTTPDTRSRCTVTAARLVYGANADASLMDPLSYSSPAPGIANKSALGPSHGPEPNTNSELIYTGNVFEYHSDLNGKDGCTSRQYKQDLWMVVEKASGTIVSVDRGSGFAGDWKEDNEKPGERWSGQRSWFDLTTSSGRHPLEGGIVTETSKEKIHWIDAPGIEWNSSQNRMPGFARVMLVVLKSVTYDDTADKHAGRECSSRHTVVVDLETGNAMPPAAVKSLFAMANPGNSKDKLIIQGVAVLRGLQGIGAWWGPPQPAYAGQANPEFRDLGCKRFESLKEQ